MGNLEDWPHDFVWRDVGGGLVSGVFHIVGETEELVFDVAEASRRGFALGGVADGGHDGWFDGVFRR